MIMRDVIAIGSAVRDAYFETDAETIRWGKTPSGRALVLPMGGKTFIDDTYFHMGGNAVNASVTFARQGLRTSVFAKVGGDVSAQEIRKSLKAEKVDTKLLKTSKLPTSYSVILLQDGERSIITYRGASNDVRLDDIPLKTLKSKWWYVSISGDSYKMLDKLLRYAKKNKIKVALNPSDRHLSGAGRKKLLGQLKDIDFLVVNGEEASLITGVSFKKEIEMFNKLDELVPGMVAVTYGPRGVSVSDGNYIYRAGIFKDKKIADRLGAGDAFGSGFVAGLIRKREKFKKSMPKPENIEYAMRLASANSTSVIEHIGGTTGALTRKDFDTALRFRKLKIERKEVKFDKR